MRIYNSDHTREERKLPEYFMVGSDGALYDTRQADWSANPVRKDYAVTRRTIETVADVKATLRAGEYTFPGAYRLAFIACDGGLLSYDAVLDNLHEVFSSISGDIRDGWKLEAVTIVDEMEGQITCDHTNEVLKESDTHEYLACQSCAEYVGGVSDGHDMDEETQTVVDATLGAILADEVPNGHVLEGYIDGQGTGYHNCTFCSAITLDNHIIRIYE